MGRTDEREFHIWAAETDAERAQKKESLKQFLGYLKDRKAIADLGCGEGVFLELLGEKYPDKKSLGVDLNGELLSMCLKMGLNVKKMDAAGFVKSGDAKKFDAFVMLDLFEHLDFGKNMGILKAVPAGAILIIKTPNTNSSLGHQFYLQCPGHVAPYSPFTIGKMLERTGFRKLAEGETDYCCGRICAAVIRAVSPIFRKLFGAYAALALGGGNYFVVAEKKP